MRRRIKLKWRRRHLPSRSTAGLIVLGIATLALLAASVLLGEHDETSPVYVTVLQSLSEALIVASVLALTVDSYLKRRAFREIANDTFWALLNPDAPGVHREAVEEAARGRVFYESVQWSLNFEWADDRQETMSITLFANTRGISYDKDGFAPSGKRYLVASANDYMSQFLYYELSGEWSGKLTSGSENTVSLRAADEPTGTAFSADISKFVSTDGDREIFDEGQVRETYMGDAMIVPKTPFAMSRKVRYFRRREDYFPMVLIQPHLAASFRAYGPALQDVDAAMLDTYTGEAEALEANTGLRYGYGPRGRTFIVSWRRKEELN